MAEENEHIQKLISAPDREVEHRRKVVAALAQKYERGTMENNREIFIRNPKYNRDYRACHLA